MPDAKNGNQDPHSNGNGAVDPAQDNAPAAGEAPVAAEAAALAALETERNELRDKLLRTLAEMENLRRRTEKEVADARSYGMTGFARDMLSVADNLRRAIDSLPQEAASQAEGALKALLDGIDLTERDLLKTLERHGVKKLDPAGQKFDPHLHQAMFEAPDPQAPKGTVVQVVQSGFVIGDRVLRPAMVGVSAGAPGGAAKPASRHEPVDRKA